MLVFPGPPSCSNFASASNPIPCSGSGSSPVISSVDTNSIIHIHQEQCLTIKIVKNVRNGLEISWNNTINDDFIQGPYFDFHIWQSPSLVKNSCGVCVNWNCKREYRGAQFQPHPTIKELCNIFLEAARNSRVGTVNNKTIEIARTLCINDLQESFETQVR